MNSEELATQIQNVIGQLENFLAKFSRTIEDVEKKYPTWIPPELRMEISKNLPLNSPAVLFFLAFLEQKVFC